MRNDPNQLITPRDMRNVRDKVTGRGRTPRQAAHHWGLPSYSHDDPFLGFGLLPPQTTSGMNGGRQQGTPRSSSRHDRSVDNSSSNQDGGRDGTPGSETRSPRRSPPGTQPPQRPRRGDGPEYPDPSRSGPPTPCGDPGILTVKFKPDRKDYPILKTDDGYLQWKEDFRITLHGHGLQVVLNLSFWPTTPAEADAIKRIRYWVYNILNSNVLTYHGKAIVRQYRDKMDATSTLYSLDLHYMSSTAGRITAARLLAYLTNHELDSSWTKPYAQFITDWMLKAEQCNDMCDGPAQLHETHLMSMLQRAVHSVPALRQVANQEDLSLAKGDTPLTFGNYYTLLMSAAITQDTASGRRRAHVAQLTDNATEDEDAVVSRLINNVETRPRLPDEIFAAFTAEDRKQWIGLSKEAKQRIVNLFTGKPARRVNNVVTEPDHDADVLPDAHSPDDDASTETTVVVANQAQSQGSTPASAGAHPGDVRRVLAQQSKPTKGTKPGKRTVSSARIAHHTETRPSPLDDDSDSEFSLDLGDLPSADLSQWDDPHAVPLYDDSSMGRAAWHAQMHGTTNDAIDESAVVSAFETLATYPADYEGSTNGSVSSEDSALWCDTRNEYYDSLDF